ncbi:Hsp20/alpha crystallin family protein [Haloterrigena alkaliphila]|uniref:Hsp20/alpha crystallin family protein n=1 Tax=Haloterrigena alkaliphila TaxID=2816475 RepID=A0A8A2VHF1_9EURY|nr:Hsp20/alpha crystallin family protein [Haloterrigena alkaliphila]QSX00131.1 Hsp20/alpha crystallin family protein [Haloterrigena alkaliphila]
MSAFGGAETTTFPFPTRVLSDRVDDCVRVVVDVSPAAVDDLTVEAGTTRVRIEIDRDGERYARVFSPLPSLPPRRGFGDDRSAVYNNGVLTVSLETTRRRRR